MLASDVSCLFGGRSGGEKATSHRMQVSVVRVCLGQVSLFRLWGSKIGT